MIKRLGAENYYFIIVTVLFFQLILISCENHVNKDITKAISLKQSWTLIHLKKTSYEEYSESELKLIKFGLVDVKKLDSSLIVEMKYASEDNFMGWNVYDDLKKCFLQPDVALKLLKSQQYLKQLNKNYTLKLLDCARPQYVQQIIFDSIKLPQIEKMKYVSNPKKGSLHNFGAAVDITIYNSQTNTDLDMGTEFDCMEEKAHPIEEKRLIESGILSIEQVNNRQILRAAMYHGGFFNIQTEWWHFNSCKRDSAIVKYKLIP